MPELPEVEITKRGISPHITHKKIEKVLLRRSSLRWIIPAHLPETLPGQVVFLVDRRAKYLLLKVAKGTLIIHLGMSGTLQLVDLSTAVTKHDHFDLCFENDLILRFNDPRRFGALLWSEAGNSHPLLKKLGPEPLSNNFDDILLYEKSRGKKQAVKSFIMDSKVVVGLGNIYATEALFMAGVRPDCSAEDISKTRYALISKSIRKVLQRAINCGGTTLKDFKGSDGKPGYFAIELSVYGKKGEPCPRCSTIIKSKKIGQRASCFCPACQQ